MGTPTPTYQSTAAGTTLAAGDTVWIYLRHENGSNYPRSASLSYLDFYVGATQPNPGVTTPVLSHNVTAGQPISELAVFSDSVDSRLRMIEWIAVPVEVTTPTANNLGPKGSPLQGSTNRDKYGVVYLGTDKISDRDDNGLL